MDKYRKVMKPKAPLAAKWELKNWKPVDHGWSVLDCPKNWPVKDLKDFRSFFSVAEISYQQVLSCESSPESTD